jgi:pyrroline-5-carboxylate reductase
MTPRDEILPVLLLGAGHMGGALIAGWRRADAAPASEIWVRDPTPGVAAQAAANDGARLNPPDAELNGARTLILALKPQVWTEIAQAIEPFIAADALIISIMAGVTAKDIGARFPGRPVVRAMPNTACAIGQGAVGIWAEDSVPRTRAGRLFAPLGVVVDLESEDEIHAVTAASGSAPAYVYALVEALEAAGRRAGLAPEAARNLSRAALTGAAALMAASGEEASELRRQVTSPKGTTQAALDVLIGDGDGALEALVTRAVLAAKTRSRQLGGES